MGRGAGGRCKIGILGIYQVKSQHTKGAVNDKVKVILAMSWWEMLSIDSCTEYRNFSSSYLHFTSPGFSSPTPTHSEGRDSPPSCCSLDLVLRQGEPLPLTWICVFTRKNGQWITVEKLGPHGVRDQI